MEHRAKVTPYLQNIANQEESLQREIEALLCKYNVTPVGNGFIDLIVSPANALKLIDDLAVLNIATTAVTLWCHALPEHTALGCPHGAGGPKNRFGPGWFSECYHYPMFDVEEHGVRKDDERLNPEEFAALCRTLIREYIQDSLPAAEFYTPCLQPALWLHVPKHWQRQTYFTGKIKRQTQDQTDF